MRDRCMCGATDCPSCGPDQGYTVVKRPNGRGGWSWVNPEEGEDDHEDYFDPPDDYPPTDERSGNIAD